MSTVIPVTAAHRFGEAKLIDYLRDAGLAGTDGAVSIGQFQGGQSNPTFLVTAGPNRYVLRKKPPGDLLPSAHMVEREYRVMKALADHTGVPVPRVRVLCEDSAVVGTPFYVMDFLHGRIISHSALPDLVREDRLLAHRS
ncbi:MAG: phosphotransferase, partial [Pseudomonadota bacterium]|nr:phosphotransferase [Pseudomonadota bacterium]